MDKQVKPPILAAFCTIPDRLIPQGDFDGAEICFRQLLAIKPDHAEALTGIGQKLCWQRKRREGLAYLRRVIKVKITKRDCCF